MANQEHVDRLLQGVEEWNRWRRENPDVELKLWRANLSGANLSGANLSEADLSFAYLLRADFNLAVVKNAVFYGTAGLTEAQKLNLSERGVTFEAIQLIPIFASLRSPERSLIEMLAEKPFCYLHAEMDDRVIVNHATTIEGILRSFGEAGYDYAPAVTSVQQFRQFPKPKSLKLRKIQ